MEAVVDRERQLEAARRGGPARRCGGAGLGGRELERDDRADEGLERCGVLDHAVADELLQPVGVGERADRERGVRELEQRDQRAGRGGHR